jgi:tetratricopeptide (TPR) repeat protein
MENLEDIKKSIQKTVLAMAREPRNTEHYHELAKYYAMQEDYDKVVSVYESLLNIDPQDEQAIINIGSIYYFEKEMDKKRTSRLNKELKDLETYGDTFKVEVDPNNFQLWKISFKGAEGTLYANEDFTLQFKFPNDYVRKYILINIYICIT